MSNFPALTTRNIHLTHVDAAPGGQRNDVGFRSDWSMEADGDNPDKPPINGTGGHQVERKFLLQVTGVGWNLKCGLDS